MNVQEYIIKMENLEKKAPSGPILFQLRSVFSAVKFLLQQHKQSTEIQLTLSPAEIRCIKAALYYGMTDKVKSSYAEDIESLNDKLKDYV